MKPKQHAELKALGEDDNLRDHMSSTELAITTLGQRAAVEIISGNPSATENEGQNLALKQPFVRRESSGFSWLEGVTNEPSLEQLRRESLCCPLCRAQLSGRR